MSFLDKLFDKKAQQNTADEHQESVQTDSVEQNVAVDAADPVEEVNAQQSTAEVNLNQEEATTENSGMAAEARHTLLYWEAAYRSQEVSLQEHIVFPRSESGNMLTIKAVLDRFFPYVKDHYIGNVTWAKTESSAMVTTDLEEVAKVLEKSPFDYLELSALDSEEELADKNSLLSIGYELEGKSFYLTLVIKPVFKTANSLYARLSVMKPFEGGEDLAGVFSQTLPAITSVLLAYDFNDATADLQQYEAVEEVTVRKVKAQEELSEEEQEVMYGMGGMRNPIYNLTYGQWLIEQNRLYDAYAVLMRAYNVLKPQFHFVENDGKEVFFRICHCLGFCLLRIGFLDKAAYFLNLSTLGGEPYVGLYVECLAQSAHNRVYYFLNQLRSQSDSNEAAANELKRLEAVASAAEQHQKVPEAYQFDNVTLGYVLHKWFDLMPYTLLDVTVDFHNGEVPEVITSKPDMWMYSLTKLENVSIYVHYSCAFAETGFPGDKSENCSDNVLVVQVQPVQTAEGVAYKRVNVMAPNFSKDDDKKVMGPCNVPSAASFILGEQPLQKEIEKAQLKDILLQAIELKNGKRIVEALHAFEYIHYALKVAYTQADADDDMEALFFEATYQLGSCFVELGLYEKALYYLDWAQEGYNVEYMAEYVNGLCNSADIRALEEINAVLEHLKEPEDPAFKESYENYKAFLQRRKSYVLIGRHRLDEAEVLLKEMLESPLSREYAENELKFIERVKNSQEQA